MWVSVAVRQRLGPQHSFDHHPPDFLIWGSKGRNSSPRFDIRTEGKEDWFFWVSGSRPRKVNPEVVRKGKGGLDGWIPRWDRQREAKPHWPIAYKLEVRKSPTQLTVIFLSPSLCLHHQSLDVAEEESFIN